jgi:hypothetical protein
MINLVKVISTNVDNLGRRIVKILRFGNSDVQTVLQAGPYGSDTNPIKDMIAIYAQTGEKGKTACVGFLNKNQLAEKGEHRIFSTNDAGVVQTFIWLKNDGTMQIGGDTDFMVRYSKLEEAFNELQNKFNQFANSYAPGSPSTLGTPPTVSPSTADISECKIEQIKTI